MESTVDYFDSMLDDVTVDNAVENDSPMTVEEAEIVTPEEEETTEGSTEESTEESTKEVDNQEVDYSNNAIYSYLQERGIKDPGKIVFTNEDGTEESLDFNSLSVEEQLEVLRQVSDPGFSEEEINTITTLRKSGMTLNQMMDAYAKKAIEELNKGNQPEKTYKIDDYTDDDLFLVNLKRQYPDFSDDDLLAMMTNAKENEDLYKKQTEILRKSYKEMEDQAEAERKQQEEQQAIDLRNNLIEAAGRFNEIQLDYRDEHSDSLVIEEKDKPQMISYILDEDATGKSQLVKDLENPDTLIELAWLRTQGAEVLSNITSYWKGILANERAENKKLRAQLDKVNRKNGGAVIVPKIKEVKDEPKTHLSVWDNSGLI